MKNSKLLTSGIAVALAGALLFGGTFAWQSISQTALNEVAASINPGGRLHDDFNNVTGTVTIPGSTVTPMAYDKDVYVENFTKYANNGVQVFARVRLDEYMELGTNAGKLDDAGKKDTSNKAVSLVAGATLDDKSTWTTHLFGTETDTTNPFHQYWNWEMGGSTVYMPTFNTNKDSLEADINGSFKGNFKDHTDYTVGDTLTAYAVYDVDTADTGTEKDEIVEAGLSASDFISAADDTALNAKKALIANVDDHIKVEPETHTARETINGTVMSMETYLARLAAAAIGEDVFDGTGDFWVYDTDGWAYWANPINPETATGLLLNSFHRTDAIINQDWYYAINVVAQFVTGDDLGQDDGTGFYAASEGTAPTANALLLLNNIGVDVKFTATDEASLAEALAHGGTVTLASDVSITDTLTVDKDTVIDLGAYELTAGTDIWSDSKEDSALLYVDGATVVINGGDFAARTNDSYAITVANGGKVVINGGNFEGNMTSVYVYEGEAVIYGGTFSIKQEAPIAGEEYDYVLNCYDVNYANGTAKITVCGGTFEKFDPSNCKAEGTGTNFVAGGYTAATSDGGATYTVTKTTT